jgi:hypothetical protein
MRRSTLTACVLLAAASAACKKDEPAAAPAPAEQPMAVESVAAPAPTPEPQQVAPPVRQAPVPAPPVATVRDVPYVSTDTGTIAPGMTESDVTALWGRPVAVSRTGNMTYLYFPNSCELSCGTLDVVFFENGRVVDAVLRWPGHGYSGQSSSPPGTTPAPTLPSQPTQ